MGHAANRARALMEEDGDFAEAITIIRDLTEGEAEVEWRDVKEDLTSGQWGRLIQEGVLESGEDGFLLADPEGIAELLDEGYEPISFELEEIDAEVSWTQYDKFAAVMTGLLFVGYWYEPFRELIGTAIDLLIGPFAGMMPFFSLILVLALLTGLYSSLLQANLTDREVVAAYQAQMQTVQERRKLAQERGDEEALERIQEQQLEAMGGMLEMFKAQFRPMVWIMVLTIPVFLWLLWAVSSRLGTPAYDPAEFGEIVLPLSSGPLGWSDEMIWILEPWLVWYFVCSLAFTQVIRKSLNIQMSPTG